MKKEAVSVLKPRKGKKTDNKVKKVIKKTDVKSENKKIEKSIPSITEPRVKKLKISNVENVNIGNNLKRLTSNLPESIDVTKKKSKILTKIDGNKNGKTKKPKNDALVKSKMATIRKDRENEKTRGEAGKKLKIQKIEEPIVKIDTKKRIKAKIEKPEQTTDVKSEVTKKLKTRTGRKKNIENSGDLKLTKQHILSSIKAMKKLAQKALKSKKSLLPMENLPVYLQVTCVKIPKTPRRQIRPYLPHPIATSMDDIAIFVPDLELGRKKDYEKTVDHWETKFREKGVDCIKQIIPMNQLKTEYNQFEMRRKLASSFDYFLTDGRIAGHLTHLLGKGFLKRRDAPTPLKLSRDNLKEEIDFALHKTCMEIHGFGNSHTVKVGTVSMKSAKLSANVWATCETLAKDYPGGWANVRAIQIKSQNGPSIPIYLTLVSKNKVSVPIVKPRRPRAYETVEGELTTLPGHANVTVTPEGKVKLIRTRDFEDDEENDEIKEEEDENDDKDTDDEEKKVKVEDDNDDDDDDKEDDEDDDDDKEEDEDDDEDEDEK